MDEDHVVATLRAAGCVFAEEEARLLREAGGDLEAMLARRVAGEPLEQVLGWADFAGVRVRLLPGVFVPRQRTVLMVEEALACLAGVSEPVVLDLCCGSGAVGLAVAARVPVELWAADLEPTAVRCARANLAPVGGRVVEGDLFEPLPAALRGRVHALPCNVPYVPTDAIAAMPPEARDHEPRVTLDGGPDGLDVLRRVAAAAHLWLAPAGCVLFETSSEQARVAVELLRRGGLRPRVVEDRDRGATVVVGQAPD